MPSLLCCLGGVECLSTTPLPLYLPTPSPSPLLKAYARKAKNLERERERCLIFECMYMEKFKCKLCLKQFMNGKALGGHMRSHLAVLPLPPKTPPQKQQDSMDGGGRSESTLSEEGGLRGNPRKSVRLVDRDPEFLDRESESESTRNPTRRRSKRGRRVFLGEAEEEEKGKAKVTESSESAVLSSFSDEEEIARCLMTLSQDVWSKSGGEKFQCEICCRNFKSSQALGSHRTIHNRGEIEQKPRNPAAAAAAAAGKMHECPFCGKLFVSGQALGGHKRSHIVHSPASTSKLIIDLNLPAPMEDDDEPEAEVSAVSDAEPVPSHEGR
ncbi:PREDICTED: zinc finger protein ZAT1-like [Ipomoea nil]|uniref:zinc finger protein ZAT1-like n=1 Tax=Ipomoea nil TaxID=35883 RepID=UPI000901ED0C|nr:PREDICTED: zinc finger protein ZAT1-like [Ipomoea nil]